ncbi:MAG: flagellar FliJ family protein [Planctomycetota bacterium]
MAKRFRFRLEFVRKLREQARDVQRRRVADSARTVTATEQAVARLQAARSRNAEATREAQSAGLLDVASLRCQYRFHGWLMRKQEEFGETLQTQRTELDGERCRLGEVTAKLRVIEKLKERQWRGHLDQLRREEQAVDDEVALRIASWSLASDKVQGAEAGAEVVR